MLACVDGISITGISATIPKNKQTLVERLNGNITEKKARRFADSVGFHSFATSTDGQTAGDLCFKAACDLMTKLQVDPESIDAIIFLSQMPDYVSPPTSAVLQAKLGLSNEVVAMDVNQGCPGYVYGLYLASCLVSAGQCNRILLCVGDTKSKVVYPGDMSTSAIFGDAGTATLIENGNTKLQFNIKTIGEKHSAIMTVRGAGRLPRVSPNDSGVDEEMVKQNYLKMDGVAVMDFTLDAVPKSIFELLAHIGLEADGIDMYALHQANKIIVDSIAAKLEIETEKAPFLAGETGNSSSASIPLLLACSEGAFNKEKVLVSGFGVGLSIADAVVDLSNTKFLGVSEI